MGLVLDVLSIGFVVLWSGIYLSALVDWFVILPKVSGISCPAPCERPGRQRWAGITALWCFHRGLARIVVPVVLIGCPAAIGAITKSGSGRAICFTIAAVVSVYLAEYELQGKTALGYSLNGRRYVGDSVWLVHETPYEVTRRAGYLVDVAAEGGKFKYLTDDGDYTGAPFAYKHDDDGPPVALDKLNGRPRVEHAVTPCGEVCAGVNWYCWRNPLAYSQTSDADDEDVDDTRAEELGSPRSRREKQSLPHARDDEQATLPDPRQIEQRVGQGDGDDDAHSEQHRDLTS